MVATTLLMSSCLKNNKYYVDFADYEAQIELPLAASNVNLPALALFDAQDTPTTYYAVVNVASMDKPGTPVTATLALDEEWLNKYNADNDAAVKQKQSDYLADTAHKITDSDYPKDWSPYFLLPDSTYSIPSFDVTVPAGQRQAKMPILITTNQIDLAKKYILPLTIVKSSLPISNWNHLMVSISAKNQWDGKYTYTGTTSLGDADGETAKMSTVGQFSVTMNLINYYSNQVVFTVDPNTNKVTVSMTTLLPIATDPSSYWDPATKTFHVKWTSNAGARHYDETYVKQ
jgi:hypothetical protein